MEKAVRLSWILENSGPSRGGDAVLDEVFDAGVENEERGEEENMQSSSHVSG